MRHGGGLAWAEFDELEILALVDDEELFAVHEAIDRLVAVNPKQAERAKLRPRQGPWRHGLNDRGVKLPGVPSDSSRSVSEAGMSLSACPAVSTFDAEQRRRQAGPMGFPHFKPGNRAKSASVEYRTQLCSRASAARCASETRLPPHFPPSASAGTSPSSYRSVPLGTVEQLRDIVVV